MPNVHGLRELMESRAVFHLFAKVPQRGWTPRESGAGRHSRV